MTYYDSPNCAPGTYGFSFNQFGVLTSQGASASIPGATDFTMTTTTSSMSTPVAPWVTHFDTHCSTQDFATTGSVDMAGVSCGGVNSQQWAVSWPSPGTALKNSFTLSSGTPRVLRMNLSINDTYAAFKMGAAGYPGALTTDLSY